MKKKRKLVRILEERRNEVLVLVFLVMVLIPVLVGYAAYSIAFHPEAGFPGMHPAGEGIGEDFQDEYDEVTERMWESYINESGKASRGQEIWYEFVRQCHNWLFDCEGDVPEALLRASIAYLNTTNETVIRKECHCDFYNK